MWELYYLIIKSNKRVKCCFFLQRENRLTNHIHRSIFTATTPVPEQTENIPSECINNYDK